MKIEDIEIHTGSIEKEYKEIRPIIAKVGAATAFSKSPTIEDVNLKLREKASEIGANAVINVSYDRGVTLTSWKGLTATGLAVTIISDEKDCPYCAEKIKTKAIKCKHCGADVPQQNEQQNKKYTKKISSKAVFKNLPPLPDDPEI